MLRNTLVLPRTLAETEAEIGYARWFEALCGRKGDGMQCWFRHRRRMLERHRKQLQEPVCD